jgi:hypothetical protein
MAGFKVMALNASVKTIFLIVALSAWCGGMWINVRAIRQARAAGYSFWSFDPKARRAAWRGRNLPLFLMCAAIFAAAILVPLVLQ